MYNADDINTAYDNFIQIIDNLFSKCCSIIVIKFKRKSFDKPWTTTGLKNSCKEKNYCILHF